jgi:DNA invertase Pin-like site-specific DNA recombinase
MNRRRHQPGAPKRAALYSRSSQLKPQGETGALGEQVDRCVAYCLEHGYIVPQDQRLASLQAGSAASDRPALARLLEAIRQGGAAVVVVRGPERLARDRAQGIFLFEEFRAEGVSITNTGS